MHIIRRLRLLAAVNALLAAVGAGSIRAGEPVPPVPNLAGKILPVLGPMDPAEIGFTAMHEHIFIARIRSSARITRPPSDLALCEQTISLQNLSAFRHYKVFPDRDCRNNFFDLTDLNDAI